MEAIHCRGTQRVQSAAIIEGEKNGTDLKSLHVLVHFFLAVSIFELVARCDVLTIQVSSRLASLV